MPSTDPSSPPSKFCPACARDLPLDAYGFRVNGQPTRRSRCHKCYAAYMRVYRLIRRAKSLGAAISAIKRSTDLSRTEALATAAMQRFGGLDGFANEWKGQYEATKPGSTTACNMLGAVVGLLTAVDAMRQPPAPPKPSKPAKPPRRDPLGLGKDYDMSQYVTEEDIQMELAKMMENRRDWAGGR